MSARLKKKRYALDELAGAARGTHARLTYWLRAFSTWLRMATLDVEAALADPTAPTAPKVIEAFYLALNSDDSPFDVRHDNGTLTDLAGFIYDVHKSVAHASYPVGEEPHRCATDGCGEVTARGEERCAHCAAMEAFSPPPLLAEPEARAAAHAIAQRVRAAEALHYEAGDMEPDDGHPPTYEQDLAELDAFLAHATRARAAWLDPFAPGAAEAMIAFTTSAREEHDGLFIDMLLAAEAVQTVRDGKLEERRARAEKWTTDQAAQREASDQPEVIRRRAMEGLVEEVERVVIGKGSILPPALPHLAPVDRRWIVGAIADRLGVTVKFLTVPGVA